MITWWRDRWWMFANNRSVLNLHEVSDTELLSLRPFVTFSASSCTSDVDCFPEARDVRKYSTAKWR